ncbi:MAG TPA: hypothetical protein VMU04_24750 [Candidatus Acidoferrum sp.]|nr:hypothetical protein [Candidatus Acidoferrum sp.]
MTTNQIRTAQRCASNWNQAEQWKRSQQPDRSRRDPRPFNTVEQLLADRMPTARVRVMGLPVSA